MAPPKQVVEVPRLLPPLLTWNSTSPRTTVAPPQAAATSSQLQNRITGSSSLRRQLHNSAFHSHSSTPLSSLSRYSSSAFPNSRRPSTSINTSSSKSAEPLSNPIRHNGVYVTAFKPARRAFHASAVRQRDHHFDTLKFVQRLKKEGFSEEQAVAMMRVLNDVIQESIQNLTRTMVLREG